MSAGRGACASSERSSREVSAGGIPEALAPLTARSGSQPWDEADGGAHDARVVVLGRLGGRRTQVALIASPPRWLHDLFPALLVVVDLGPQDRAQLRLVRPLGRARSSSPTSSAPPVTGSPPPPPNLEVQLETYAYRVLIKDGTAVGAETSSGILNARREVIVSEGAFESPKLLILSGIRSCPATPLVRHRGEGRPARRCRPRRSSRRGSQVRHAAPVHAASDHLLGRRPAG